MARFKTSYQGFILADLNKASFLAFYISNKFNRTKIERT
jgi:hypothetical protein